MKTVVVEATRHPSACEARVGVRRGVELAVGGVGIDARSGCPAGPLILNAYVYESHRSPPAAGLYVPTLFCAPGWLWQAELGLTAPLCNVGEAVPARPPAPVGLPAVPPAPILPAAPPPPDTLHVTL